MKYFIDTHDKTKGSFPQGVLTEQAFLDQFDALEAAAAQFHVGAHAAHINLQERKAFCFMSGPTDEAIWQAHAAVHLPYDSITEGKRVTGADLRLPATVQRGTTQARAAPVRYGAGEESCNAGRVARSLAQGSRGTRRAT